MSTDKRARDRRIINRKDFDMDCPVDQEVMKVLHTYGKIQVGEKAAIGCQVPLDTIKMIRKDVIRSLPDLVHKHIDAIDVEVLVEDLIAEIDTATTETDEQQQ